MANLDLPNNHGEMSDKDLVKKISLTKETQTALLNPVDDVLTELESIGRLMEVALWSVVFACRRLERINKEKLYLHATDTEGNLLVDEHGEPYFKDFKSFFEYYKDLHRVPRSIFFKAQSNMRRIEQLNIDENVVTEIPQTTLYDTLSSATKHDGVDESGGRKYTWTEKFEAVAAERNIAPEQLMNEILTTSAPKATLNAYLGEDPPRATIIIEESYPDWMRLDVWINGKVYSNTFDNADEVYINTLAKMLKAEIVDGVVFPEQASKFA